MNVAPQFQKYIDNDYNILDINTDAIRVEDPPTDDSHTTRMELEELEGISREAKIPKSIMNIADKNPLELFFSLAKKNNLDPLEDEVRAIADDWTKLSFYYKLMFKRRRPWEVKKEHDIDFVVNKSDSSESPSYPSGHAMMGYGVAEFYKDKYPLMADKWDNIADVIAHSRLQAGVHYPSDVKASKSIVSQANSQIKQASYIQKAKNYVAKDPMEALKQALPYYYILREALEASPVVKVSEDQNNYVTTVSEQDWASKEHSNTKIPRWFKETAMQEAIADELGFTEDNAPTFHKNEDPMLRGSNAYYNPASHQIHYDMGEWTPGVLAHEIGHSTQELSPVAKAFNITKDLARVNALPLALAAGGYGINKNAPTLIEGLKASGGLTSKLKTLAEGAKGRGGRWAMGAAALGGLGVIIEEARASSKGKKAIDRLVRDGILTEEQGAMAHDTMDGAFNTYVKNTPFMLGGDILGHTATAAAARLLPNKYRLGLAGALGALRTGGILAGHLGALRDNNNSILLGNRDLLQNPMHELNTKTAGISINSILKATEGGLNKLKLNSLADRVALSRGKRTLSNAVKDLEKYRHSTARFGQMPRIVIPKSHLNIKDLERLGFEKSLIAVPEVGQTAWTTYRHPIQNLHLHEHGDLLNLHVDSLPSLQMIKERNKLTRSAYDKLLETVPSGVGAWARRAAKNRTLLSKINDQASGIGHAILEGGPGYINYILKSLNPYRTMGMADEIISKLPKDYLKKRYGYTNIKTSSHLSKKASPAFRNLSRAIRTSSPAAMAVEQGARKAVNISKRIGKKVKSKALQAYTHPKAMETSYKIQDWATPAHNEIGSWGMSPIWKKFGSQKTAVEKLRDSIAGFDPMLQKTSSEQPLFPHRSTLLIRDPETGKLLAAKEPEGSLASPFYFPGGGLYDDEYDTPRNPSNEDIIEGARREALEELGIQLDNPRVVGSHAQELEDWWKEKVIKTRGVPYVGGHEHYVLADRGKEDRSLYNVEGDAFEQGDYYDPAEIVEALSRAAKSDSTFAPFNREQVRTIKDNLLSKEANLGNLARNTVRNFNAGIEQAGKAVHNTMQRASKAVSNEASNLRNLPVSSTTFKGPRGQSATISTSLKDRAGINKMRRRYGQAPRNESITKELVTNPRYRSNVGYHYAANPYVQQASSYVEPVLQHGDDVLNLVSKLSSYAEKKKASGLKKKASDLSVLTAVPTQNLDLIMRKGLYSQKAMLDDPEVMAAFLAQRNADKAWKNDEQYDEKRFREQYDKRVGLMEGNDAPLAGPSVFFTEPDPDKVSDPRHFVNKFDTQKLRVNLAKLLQDIPETRITGAELIPSSAAENMSDEEFKQYVKDRRRDITPEEAAKYIATDPKELWKHYKDEYLGRYYAADVPHAFIRTPSGIIPPEYLEPVEKTSEAKRLYHGSPLDLEELELRVPPHHTGKGEAGEAGVYAADNPIAAALYALARNKSRGSWGVTKDNRLVMKDYKELNPEGYVYELDSKDYIPPPEDHPALGYAVKDPSIISKRKVTEGDIADYIDRVASKEEFTRALQQVEKTSSAKEQLRHILVTGHSGAGKSTYARQLAEELGMPVHELDSRAKEILSQDYPEHEGLGWPGDLSERVVREALALDTPHVIEGTQIHDVPDLGTGLRRILVDTPEDRVVEQRAAREYEKRKVKNKPYRPMEGHRDAARKLVDYYRDSIDNFRGLPGVESIVPEVKQAALEDEFQPDLTPDDLKALGVYDQVYGDAPSEASMKEWPEHWINPQDPLGWLQWYDRYSEGRRTDDDERQIKRWKSFKARHLAQYLNKPTPRRAAALRNWGIDVERLKK